MPYRLFLPPFYHTRENAERRYPVIYLLHGVGARYDEWSGYGVEEVANELLRDGKFVHAIIVAPQGGLGYWVNQEGGGVPWADYVSGDLVGHIDTTLRTLTQPEARAIGGLSMGGEGALRIAMQNPDVFGIAAAHSPSLRTSFDQFAPELQELFGDEESWRAATPLWLVVDTDTAYDLTLAIDVGEDDPWRPNVELLHKRMLNRGISHRFEVLPGGHEAEYWIEHVPDYLHFYGSALET